MLNKKPFNPSRAGLQPEILSWVPEGFSDVLIEDLDHAS